jgi:hypothetical protein
MSGDPLSLSAAIAGERVPSGARRVRWEAVESVIDTLAPPAHDPATTASHLSPTLSPATRRRGSF